MRTLTIPATLTAIAIAAAPFAFAQTAPGADTASPAASSCGCEMGGGMMGGNGHGHGAHGHGVMGSDEQCQGMMGSHGPGMMGHGPGMMGHGPGMMGHGPGMIGGGPGMMGGGPGIMGGGPGMMGMRMYAALDLTDQQRAKIARIFEDVRKKNWDAMGKVMDGSATLRDLYSAPTHDPAAIGRQTVRIAELKRPIIESMVTAHDQIEALLTTEQKDRLRGFGRGLMMPGE